MIYGARKKQEFWADKTNLKALKDAIDDDGYYRHEEFRDIFIKGSFDSDIICKPCSEKRNNWPVYCTLAQAIASDRPFAIVCPKYDTNYMEFMK